MRVYVPRFTIKLYHNINIKQVKLNIYQGKFHIEFRMKMRKKIRDRTTERKDRAIIWAVQERCDLVTSADS